MKRKNLFLSGLLCLALLILTAGLIKTPVSAADYGTCGDSAVPRAMYDALGGTKLISDKATRTLFCISDYAYITTIK